MAETKLARKKLNKGISQMILSWVNFNYLIFILNKLNLILNQINNFSSIKEKIKTTEELSNGGIFIELLKVQLEKNKDYESLNHLDMSDPTIRYQILKFLIESN